MKSEVAGTIRACVRELNLGREGFSEEVAKN